MVKTAFRDAKDWTRRYQRNNKRSGLKNLRCFPMCTDSHRLRGFCGRPAFCEVENTERKELQAWAVLMKLPGDGEVDSGVKLGTVMTLSEITENVRSKEDPFRPWLNGQVEAVAGNDPSNLDSSDAARINFVFNSARKGWHYGWVANKHTCDSLHILRAYIFEKKGPNELQLIATEDSPSFTIFCRRRQRTNVAQLPVQLKLQLEMQDALKSEAGAGGSTVSKMPRSIAIDSQQPKTVHGSEMVLKHASEPSKRKKPSGGDGLPKTKRARKGKGQGAAGTPKIEPTSYDEKKMLLFHIMRSLLRLDVKTETPILSTVGSSDLHIYMNDERENAAGRGSDKGAGGGHFAAQQQQQQQQVPALGRPRRDSTGHFDTKSIISDVMDCFAPGLVDSDESDLVGDAHSIALSATKSNAGLDLPNLADFEPFDLDFSVLSNAEVDAVQEKGEGRKKTFVEIIKEFATYLIEEEYFTETIASALSSLNGSTPDRCKVVAVAVLLDLLRTFLERYKITLDELYHLFKTQVWEKDGIKIDDQQEAASAMIKLEKQIIIARPPPPTEGDDIKEKAETAFMNNVTHYTNTVHSPRNNSPGAPNSASYPNAVSFLGMPSVVNVSLASMINNPRHAPSSPLPVIPENDPRNDFSGTWYRPHETLDVLEGIREAIGVPWVLRKMLRYMERNLVLSHVPGCMDSQANAKLLSSGFQRYILDGKEHEWLLPPPIPTERSGRNSTYVATLKGGKLFLILTYSKRKRIIRESYKSQDGQSLQSIVRFQYRDDLKDEWQDKLKARCQALRAKPDASEEFYQNHHQTPNHDSNDNELAWLNVPCDDFGLNL